MKSGYFLIIVLCLCSCNNQFEKQDIVGAWESDELHYVIHLFDNDSCLVSNLPRNEMISESIKGTGPSDCLIQQARTTSFN